MDTLFKEISELKILPVIKLEHTEDAVQLAAALIDGGIPAAEITFRTESAAESISAILKSFPDMLVGAGTVLNPEQAEKAISAGAKFIVSPGFDSSTVRFCMDKGIPIIPGCVTASEIQQAAAMGLTVLKFFPAEQSGGIKAIKALSAPFKQVLWIPTGGINLTNIKSYISCPKVLACGGSFMVDEAVITAKDWGKVTEICSQTMNLIKDDPRPKIEPSPLFVKEKKAYDVIVMGEVLMRMAALPDRCICDSSVFSAYIGGSELNVASGTACLGLKTSIITSLPDNDIGRHVCSEMKRLGVNSELISFDTSKGARLGLYFTENGPAPRKPKVVYDRSHSSFLGLDTEFLPQAVYSSTRLFHISGITLALEQIRDTAIEMIRRFKKGGALISFDINYRANLWDEETAFQVLNRILPYVDILFVSEETSRRMFHKTGTLEDIMRSYHGEYGIRIVATSSRKVINSKQHIWNSMLYSAQKDAFFTDEPYDSIDVVDRIGSGDAYDSGVLFGLLEKGTEKDMVLYGNAMAALKCTINGDLPDVTKKEVENLIQAHINRDKSEMIR